MARVLIVDDDVLILDMCELALTKAGHTVTSVRTLTEAKSIITQRKPDCMLLDIHLREASGLSILETCAECAHKTIVLTNDDSAETVALVIGAGISDYMVKSAINFQQLLLLVEKKIAL